MEEEQRMQLKLKFLEIRDKKGAFETKIKPEIDGVWVQQIEQGKLEETKNSELRYEFAGAALSKSRS